MLKKDILDCGNLRVEEDNSKEKNSDSEVGITE